MSAGISPLNGAAPTAPAAAPGSTQAPDPRALQRFLDNATAGTQLKFRVDSDAGRVVVQVLDSQSGEVLRQIPREEALQLARISLDSNATTAGTSTAQSDGEPGSTSVRV